MKTLISLVAVIATASTVNAATAKKATAKATKKQAAVVAVNTAAVPNSTQVAAAPQVVSAEAGTSTAAIPAAATETNKVSGALVIQTAIATTDTLPGAETQTIGTTNQISMKYKMDATTSVSTGIDFAYEYQKGVNNDVVAYDPFLGIGKKTEATLLGSEKIGYGVKYYVPTSRASIDARSLGKLRLDSELGFTINPKWSAAYGISPRVSLSQVNAMNLQWIHYANASYSVSDETSVYGGLTGVSFIKNAFNANQAKLEQDDDAKAEVIQMEVGANFQIGKIGINPAFVETMKTRSAMNLGKADQQEYNLNLSATF